jgi:hypothetical protein
VPATSGQPWGALIGYDQTGLIDLSWTILQQGGSTGGQHANSAIAAAGPGYSVLPVPVLRVRNVVIDTPMGSGVYLDTSGAFSADSQNLVIDGASGFLLKMTMMALGSIPPGNYSSPMNANPMADVIGPNANVFADLTIHNYLPVRIQTGALYVGPTGQSTTPVTLTLEPGAQLRFPKLGAGQAGARVTFGTNGNAPNNLVGVLDARGTPAEPVVLTSGESTPAAGDWVGLWLDTATGSRLDHVVIEYAGAPTGISDSPCAPIPPGKGAALHVGDFSAQYVPPATLLTNSTVRYSAGYGISAIWWEQTFNTPDLTAGNVFNNNGACAQTYNTVVPPGTCPSHGCTAQ